MKKVLAIAAATGILAAASFASAGSIVGSLHDLSTTGTASMKGTGTSTQICVYCHAPHNALLSLPLWNRSNPDPTAFRLYSGLGMQNVSFKTGFTSDSTSLFCMSCHDGITNIDAVHNAGTIDGTAKVGKVWTAPAGVFATGTIVPTGPLAFGTDLTKTHPINFPVGTVNTIQNDLNVGTGASMGPGVAPGITWDATTYPLYKATADAGMSATRGTTNRSLECGSCHAVHDSKYSPFLRDTMGNSKLCLGCHNK